jgi:hypothetical protein
MLSGVVFRLEGGFECEYSCGLSPGVGFGLDELVVVVVVDQFDEVGVEEEGSFEYADDNEIDGSFLLLQGGVVLVDPGSELFHLGLNGGLIEQQFKGKPFVAFDGCHGSIK